MTTTSPAHNSRRTSADEDLAFAGVARLGELLRTGQVTSRELTEFYLARIERLNPALRAFISVRAEPALADSDAALKRCRGKDQGTSTRWRSLRPASGSRSFSAPILVVASALRCAVCSGAPRVLCPGVRPPGLLHLRGGIQSSAGGVAGR